jgi:hypothetical protein
VSPPLRREPFTERGRAALDEERLPHDGVLEELRRGHLVRPAHVELARLEHVRLVAEREPVGPALGRGIKHFGGSVEAILARDLRRGALAGVSHRGHGAHLVRVRAST